MKHLLTIIAFVCAATSLWAVPAERTRLRVRLIDGSEIFVTTQGDEHISWLMADDGSIVVPAEGHKDRFVRSQQRLEELISLGNERRRIRRIGTIENAPLPPTGAPRVAVVLVNFQDSTFSVGKNDEEIRQYYDLYCNGTRDGKNYQGHGSYGSIRDYFIAQSDSLFQPEFVIIGPVTLDHPEATYGANSGNTKDVGFRQFRKEAVEKATAMYKGDWSDFDNRGKGHVDIVFFIFAGSGENTVYTNTDLIWPKELTESVTVTLDNGKSVVFATSACCSENRLKKMASDGIHAGEVIPDGIGVMCHELSHAIGLPDLYDVNYKGFGMDVWSIMDYGCYMQYGHHPVAYTAYEREFMGWRKTQEISEAGPYVLNPIAAREGIGLKITNPKNTNEYYILEARLKTGWDGSLAKYGHGLQVTHVDYLASAWVNNRINADSNHQRMTIIAANNNYQGSNFEDSDLRETWAGNLYPYVYTDEAEVEHRNDSLTSTSVPAASLFTGGFMPHKLTQISIDEEALQVHFMLDEHLYDAVNELFNEASRSQQPTGAFDLSGRPVTAPLSKGFYIINGKKIINK
jgi:M6 family metalloprotease-like protein